MKKVILNTPVEPTISLEELKQIAVPTRGKPYLTDFVFVIKNGVWADLWNWSCFLKVWTCTQISTMEVVDTITTDGCLFNIFELAIKEGAEIYCFNLQEHNELLKMIGGFAK